jgi:hypothetical protein
VLQRLYPAILQMTMPETMPILAILGRQSATAVKAGEPA